MREVVTCVFLFFFVNISAQPDTSIYRGYSFDYVNELIKKTEDPDTLAAAYYHRARKMLPRDNEECIRLFEEGLPVIKSLGKDSIYHQAKMFYVLPLVNGARFEDAYKAIQECKNYYTAKNDLFRLASAFAVEGFLQEELSNFDEAANLFGKSLEIYLNNDFSNIHYGINNVNNHLGIVYTSLGDDEKAVEYFEKVRTYSKENGVTYFYRAAINNLAESLIALDRKEEAIPHIKEVIEIRKTNPSNVSKLGLYSNLAKLAEIEGDINLAISYQDSSIIYAEKLNNHLFIVDNYLIRGRLYKEAGNYDSEKTALEKAKNLSLDYGIQSVLPDIYLALGENELRANNPAKAGVYYKKHIGIRDSLNKVQQLKDIDKREAALAIQKYNTELLAMNARAEVRALELKKHRDRNRFLAIFSFLAIGLIAILVRNNRVNKKNEAILASQNIEIESNLEDKETLLKEIHHRVKNNLQVVSSMLNLNLRYIKDPTAKELLLESRNRVKSMALIHQKLYQEEHLKGVKLGTYLESLVNNLLFSYKKEGLSVETHFDIEDIVLDVDTLIPLGLIVNELISNSLKHAFKNQNEGNIWIKVYRESGQLVINIKDDGSGFIVTESEAKEPSFGMTLIGSLTEKLKADLTVNHENGTSVEIVIKKFSTYN